MATKKKRPTPEDRANHISAFRKSGLSQQAYADSVGLSANTLSAWINGKVSVKKARKAPEASAAPAATVRGKRTNGRFVESSASLDGFSLTNLTPSPQSVESATMTELRALVRQQALVIARLV